MLLRLTIDSYLNVQLVQGRFQFLVNLIGKIKDYLNTRNDQKLFDSDFQKKNMSYMRILKAILIVFGAVGVAKCMIEYTFGAIVRSAERNIV